MSRKHQMHKVQNSEDVSKDTNEFSTSENLDIYVNIFCCCISPALLITVILSGFRVIGGFRGKPSKMVFSLSSEKLIIIFIFLTLLFYGFVHICHKKQKDNS